MRHGLLWSLSLVAALLTQSAESSSRGRLVLAIDAAHSQVVIDVGKAGMFGFAGHAHEVEAADVRGQVTVDLSDLPHAALTLEFASAGLQVTGKGEPPADVVEVQKVMRSERVLDVAHFPAIVFVSRRISVSARTAGTADLVIEGDMTLHGATRAMRIPASVTMDAGGRFRARGTFVLKQSDFGMVPVTAAGGAIRVRDELDIRFLLEMRPIDETPIAR
jgi:polyisoprenoid-binding protein YceI